MKTYFRIVIAFFCFSLSAMASAQDIDTLKMPTMSQICEYDDLIRAEAKKIGWDWRLLASIIYQESNFKPDLVNSKGAFGLMQLMPLTMKKYHITRNSTVEEQLEAGGKVLVRLDKKLAEVVTDSLERVHFVLASYNVGMSRVLSYRELATKNGHNPNVWHNNVERYSPKQTKAFVREVTNRYFYYKASIE